MIVLDTHIWVWWVDGDARLPPNYRAVIQKEEANGLGVSVISCWEVAKLVELGRLQFACLGIDWLRQAVAYPGVQLLPLTPEVAVASTELPGSFHKDPADQIIVATARVLDCPLMTVDQRMLSYPHVRLVP